MGTLPLWAALAHSLNTVAVKLSIAIGDGSPKAGRAKIIETAHALGLNTPLTDTVSLPVGADEVTVIDMATAYSAFANGGKRVMPFAVVDIRDSHGNPHLSARPRRGPPPKQVAPQADVAQLNYMLGKVVTDGTGRAARLDNVIAAGKTGTTNSYRDAWFCGFTGNYVAAVWYGNDDYQPMNKMTGGTLPAVTWHDVMAYAHRGIETKPAFGLGNNTAPSTASASPGSGETVPASARHTVLSARSSSALGGITALIAGADAPSVTASAPPPGTRASLKPTVAGPVADEALASAASLPVDAASKGRFGTP